MTWFPGSGWPSRRTNLPKDARHAPFAPALPDLLLRHPVLLGLLVAVVGVGVSVTLVRTLHLWPNWLILPGMFLAAVGMGATAIGFSLLAVLLLQPLIARKETGWDETPLQHLGIPPALQRKCQALDYWTCEAIVEAVDKSLFPWSSLEYDERLQIDRSIRCWRSRTGYNER